MSIVIEILEKLLESEHYYKGVRVNIFGIPVSQKYRKDSYRASVNRLESKGFVRKDKLGWQIKKQEKVYKF